MKSILILLIAVLSFPQIALSQETDTQENEIKVTIIRKGSILGMANKWKVWINGEELCKLKNSSYCETSITTDSLCLIGKIKGPAEINIINIMSENPDTFCSNDLDKPEYFFRAKMGKHGVEFFMIDEKEAKKLLKKAKKKCN